MSPGGRVFMAAALGCGGREDIGRHKVNFRPSISAFTADEDRVRTLVLCGIIRRIVVCALPIDAVAASR
jgi:hypothetical protein